MAFKFLGNRKKDDRAEMSFVDHLDELRKHLIRAVIAIVICMVIVGINNKYIIDRIILGPTHEDFFSFRKICEWGHQLGMGDKMCISNIGKIGRASSREREKVAEVNVD